jgi:hypothetical protein
MSSRHYKSLSSHDHYMTPKSAWENISHFIPKDKVVWEPFCGNGQSRRFLTEIGCDVISLQEDFFENNRGEIILTNPPFSVKSEVFKRLKDLNKPFIAICPLSMLITNYFRKLFGDDEDKIQIIIPKKRITFLKTDEEMIPIKTKHRQSFECLYYCWKMNLPDDITYL